jgi:deazaflavin-dependent oxidoreductase (nitroreductase family)
MSPMTDSSIGWVARHSRRYVGTGGRDGSRWYGHDSLLLTTRGRVSGVPRRTPLFYWRDGEDYVVVVSNGGVPAYPDWYRNLLADPGVVVQVGDDVFIARARAAGPDERPRLWRLVVDGLPRYARYQANARRDLPIVLLHPE